MEKETITDEADSGLEFFRSMYDKYRDAFLDHIGELVLEDHIKQHILKYYKVLFDYNCLGGKNNRGILVILIYEYVKNRDINNSEWEKAACLAWCIEILQASFLVADDIMDKGETRRNKHCWYLLKDVETKNAVNDCLLLSNSIYKIIEIYLGNDTCYNNIIAAFRDTVLKTIIGQHLDTNIFSNKYADTNNGVDINNITVPEQATINTKMINFDVYKNVVVHKTAYYSFFLPISCGMHLSGIAMDNLLYKKIEDISIMMGEYFQAHDDYLDIYEDFTQTGKIGSDIQNNKLTWLLVKAFELCSESDKEKIIKNYGKNNVASVKIIDSIYEKYNIKEHYNKYEQAQKEKIIDAINKLQHEDLAKEIMDIENAQIHLSELQEERRKHKIALPSILKNKIVIKENDIILNNNEQGLEKYFPNIIKNPLITLEIDNTSLENHNELSWYQTMSTNISDPISKGNSTSNSFIKEMTNIYNDDDIIKLGILFVGLQAPGGHNVICGTLDCLKKKNKKNILYGFINGFEGINEYNFMELKNEYISMFRNSGGFDMINKGVNNMEENHINIKRCFKICRHLDLNGLIIVGGINISKEVAILSEYFEFIHNSAKNNNNNLDTFTKNDEDISSVTDPYNITNDNTNKLSSSIFIENQKNEYIDHQDSTYTIVSDISDEEVQKKYPKKIRRIKKKTQIISIPKSIHNEIENELVECSLGFDTTIFTTCQYISYLMSYIQTYKKGYHFVKVVGNKSSHIALECFLQTKANIVLISEEIKKKKMTLNDLVNFITDSIKIRYKNGEKKYGIIIIPEGILKNVQDIKNLVNLFLHFKTEFIKNENNKDYDPNLEYIYSPSSKIMNAFKTYIHTNMDKENLNLFQSFPLFFQNQFLVEILSDNFQYTNLGVEELLAFLVKNKVDDIIEEVEFVTHCYGNEVTSALPTNFDCAYSYILGFGCVEMIINKYNGYMCAVTNLKHILSNVNKIKIVGIPVYKFVKIIMDGKKEKTIGCENDEYDKLFMEKHNIGIKTKTKKVNLNDEYFLKYKNLRQRYLENDNYQILSGIQYNYYAKDEHEKLFSYYKSGNKISTNDNILIYKSKMENEICNKINFTITGIHNDTEDYDKKDEINIHNFDKNNEQTFNCNYYKHLNSLSKIENILTKGIIKFNTNLIRHNTTIEIIENNFGNKINCDTFNYINKITDFYIIAENPINTKMISKGMSKSVTNKYHNNYSYTNRNDNIYQPFCKSVGVVMLSHVVPGVNNILVGLHQRLSINNLKLIGFIKGIKGLLNNEICIINDNNIKSSINLGGFPLLGHQLSYNTTENEVVHIYNLFKSDNINKIIKTCENNKIINLVFIGDEKVISTMNILNEIFIKKNINIKIITVPISIYNSYDKNLIECSIGYHTTVHIISNIVSNIQRCSINLNKYYYIVKIPANISSSLLLSIQLETHCNICCIGEPVVAGHLINLFTIIEYMSLVIIERINRKKNYGVILLTSNLLFCIKEFDDLCKDVDNNVKTEMEIAQIVNQELVSDQ